MDYMKQTFSQAKEASNYDQGLRAYMLGVYNYMAMALGITGLVAFLIAAVPDLFNLINNTPLKWVVAFAPLVMVFFVMPRIMSYSLQSVQMMFWLFAGLMGASLSWVFAYYTGTSIARVLFITAGVFGGMSLYGYTTKRDLTTMGSFLIMGLIGIIIASLVNIFLQSSAMQFAVSLLGVAIFMGLTAYDTQRLKDIYYQVAGNSELAAKFAIFGAFVLYMDFINLFLQLLHFFGERK